MEGLIFGIVRIQIYDGNFQFMILVLFSSPRGLYSEGRFNGGFFPLRVSEAFIWRGLFSELYVYKFMMEIFSL